jgi:8-oxo-dGTP diphosphatase
LSSENDKSMSRYIDFTDNYFWSSIKNIVENEETSVKIKIKGLLAVRFAPKSAWFVFLADYISGTPTSDNRENDSAIFMDIKEALSSEHVSNTTKVFIKRAIDMYKKVFTLNDYVSTNNPDITRENWRLYD